MLMFACLCLFVFVYVCECVYVCESVCVLKLSGRKLKILESFQFLE